MFDVRESVDPVSGSARIMAMRATTVRFSDDLWALLEAEASLQGISAAQFVRDATIMRLGVISGRRGDVEAGLTLEQSPPARWSAAPCAPTRRW